MRALQQQDLSGPDALRIAEVPDPDPSGGVVIDVEAAGVAFPDLLLSRGLYQLKPDPPFTPGAEVAGTVAQAGGGFEEGERVMAVTGLNGFAEKAAAMPGGVFRLPESFSAEQGAGFIMNYHTSYFGLMHRGQLKEGETVLVHGAAGGVGTAAIQVAKGASARAIGVVSSDEKEKVAREAGADEVLRSDGDWLGQIKELGGADVVYDPVGGERFLNSVRSLRPEGRLLVIGFTEGEIPTIAVNRLLLKNVSVVGVGWGAFVGVRPETLAETAEGLERMAASGHVDPIVSKVYPLEDGAQALRDLDERRATGKIVLKV